MYNEKSLDNLKRNKDLTPIEKSELARKAGRRSGEVRRDKANFNKVLSQILENKPNIDIIGKLKEQGITEVKNLNYLECVLLFTANKAFSEKTTLSELIKFLIFLRDTIGQAPVQKVCDFSPIDKAEAERIINKIMNEF